MIDRSWLLSRLTPCATIFIAASETDSNLYYATKFIAPDPFIYLEIKGERILVMSDLEMDRAKSQASVDRVLSYSEIERRVKSQGIAEPGSVDIVHVVLRDAGITQLLVPSNFPFSHAIRLQALGYRIEAKREPFYERRVVKTAEEVRHIEATQRATEAAVAAAPALAQDNAAGTWPLALENFTAPVCPVAVLLNMPPFAFVNRKSSPITMLVTVGGVTLV